MLRPFFIFREFLVYIISLTVSRIKTLCLQRFDKNFREFWVFRIWLKKEVKQAQSVATTEFEK